MKWVFSAVGILALVLIPFGSLHAESTTSLYWTESGAGSGYEIKRAKLDGTNVQNLVTGPAGFTTAQLAIDSSDGKMYWSEPLFDSGIFRANLDGTSIEHIISAGVNSPSGIALDTHNGHIYWRGGNLIRKANLDGTNAETILGTSESQRPIVLALDVPNDHIYWSTQSGNAIWRSQLDGPNIEEILSAADGVIQPYAIALDLLDKKIYWSEYHAGMQRIARSNLDGTNIETLIDTSAENLDPESLVLDVGNGNLYWGDVLGGLHKATLDGQNQELIYSTGLGHLSGLALYVPTNPIPEPTTLTLAAIGLVGLCCRRRKRA